MEDLINTDLFNCDLVTYLSPLSLYNLKLTCKSIFKSITVSHIKTSIIYRINMRLSLIFGDKLLEFKKTLNGTKAIISGSFIIQCILSEYWIGSDIDVYFPIIGNKKYKYSYADPYYEIEKYLYENMNFRLNESYDAISGYDGFEQTNGKVNIKYVRTYDISRRNDETNQDVESLIENNLIVDILDESVINQENKNIKEIQVIQININNNFNDIIEFIRDTHDFDICKNVYYVENNKDMINIFKLMDILNKTTEFKIGYRLGASIERSKKYASRGFNMINNMSYIDIANKSYNLKHNTVDHNKLIAEGNVLKYENYDEALKETIITEVHHKYIIYNIVEIDENKYEILDDVVDKNHFCELIRSSQKFKRSLYVKGDKFQDYGKQLEIIRQNRTCHESCLLKFCNSHEKHICYCNGEQQIIFVIQPKIS